jgi:nicotinamide-nucleotide amidase
MSQCPWWDEPVQRPAEQPTRDGLAERIAEIAPRAGLSVAVAESLTGGMISSALAAAPGASAWFRGAVVAYGSEVKHELLDVPPGPVVSDTAAAAMAQGVRRLLRADLALAVTGAGGPDPQDGQPPGTVFFGIADDAGVRTEHLRLDRRDPAEVCADTAVEALAMLLAQLRRDAARRHSDPARAQRGPA